MTAVRKFKIVEGNLEKRIELYPQGRKEVKVKGNFLSRGSYHFTMDDMVQMVYNRAKKIHAKVREY